MQKGDLIEAINAFKTATELKPNFPEAHSNLGAAYQQQGDLIAATKSFKRAIELKPNFTDAHFNLGIAFQEQGDLIAAIASYTQSLKLKPDCPDAHHKLGIALMKRGELNSAINSFNTALELKPFFPEAHINAGSAFKRLGKLSAAKDSYNTALKLKPHTAKAEFNLSLLMLLKGDYINGWREYESRREDGSGKLHASPKSKEWDGEPLQENTQLLLVSEQGYGDTLHFMRYAQALKQQGIHTSLCAQTKLHSLIQASGIDASPLTPDQANLVTDGQWIPLLSLPKHLEVGPDNPIITEPYIHTTDELSTKWRTILSAEQRPIIGINWQGNPAAENTELRGRSLPLETFAPIAQLKSITMLSLQKGFGSEQLENCSFKDRFVSCQDQINDTWDFLETAAIVANCDLIITSDTSVAHLAGGMGKPTWLLLKKIPEWRWGLESDSTFWYPSMRLFRQKETGNWDEVLKRVSNALGAELENHPMHAKTGHSLQATNNPIPTQEILAPISLGELIDKITILQIKINHLKGPALENTQAELNALDQTFNNLQINIDTSLIQRLKDVNQKLWSIEDEIRDQERQNSFGEIFINLARSVYIQNDQRAAIKKEINTLYGSKLVEEKSYQKY